MIEVNNPEWTIQVDGKPVGENGSATVMLDRTQAHSVVATLGDKKVSSTVDMGLSVPGCLDVVGGFVFLLPFMGLLSDGAWKLYPDVIELDVSRYSTN